MPKKGDSTCIIERIRRRVTVTASGCHEFTGSIADGYGYVSSNVPGGSSKRVHMVMWEFTHGEIPKQKPQLCVLHKCDNRKCCNPKHLFLGTRKQNNDDMISKGRAILSHKGTRNPSAKLTEKQVKEIRRSKLMNAELARIYNVTKTLIASIKKRKIWRHL